MTAFDFFQAEELPAPAVSESDAAVIARERFGVEAMVTPLGSQQDANFLLADAAGAPLGVLKVANPAFTRTEIEAQDAAARFVADADPRVRTARNAEFPGVPAIAEIAGADGHTLYARVISYPGRLRLIPPRWLVA